MALQILPKTHKYPELTADNIQEIEQLAQALDEINRLTYDEMEALEARVTSAEGSITTNTANIATNVTNIGTNVTDIAALEARIGIANVKLFNGTTDSDSQTSFAHGLTSSKICGFSAAIQRSDGIIIGMAVGDGMFAAADSFRYYCNATDFFLDTVGTSLQGRPYRVILFYVD